MTDNIHYQSRTQKKKEAEALQELGLKLNALSVQQLESIDIPDNLRTAVIEGKSITSNIAGRRHRQFIGALMRDVDPESIRLALVQAEDEHRVESRTQTAAKAWVDRLLTGDPAGMEALLDECPGLERQRLRQLVRLIQKEKSKAKSLKHRNALETLIETQTNSN